MSDNVKRVVRALVRREPVAKSANENYQRSTRRRLPRLTSAQLHTQIPPRNASWHALRLEQRTLSASESQEFLGELVNLGYLDRVVNDAKVPNFTWHALRHTFISRLVMAGVDLRTAQELAGHKTISMTVRYAHLAPEHNQAAIEKLDPR
jgi:site-specific recombinase XerD